MNMLSFSLRSGETCSLSQDTLTIGQRQIPLRDIVSAGIVADNSVPVAPGMPPTPGVALQLSDGASVAFTPVEQLDCWRLLQSLYAAQPRLSAPLPPPPGAATGAMGGPGYYGAPPPYGYAPPYGYPPPYAYGMVGPSESDKTLAGICHLSVFFAPVILPLIIWLAMRDSHPYASAQAKQAFFFHLFFTIIAVGGVVALQFFFLTSFFSSANLAATDPTSVDLAMLPLVFAFYGGLALIGILDAVFSVYAAVQAFQGKPYHYPLLGWLNK